MLSLTRLSTVVFLLLSMSAFPVLAEVIDDCVFTGTSTAVPNPDDPELGAYRYCVDMSWDTGTQFALSHADVLLALGFCPCACSDFPFGAEEVAGSTSGISDSGNSCTVDYLAEYLCMGDPSIDETDGESLVKFEPIEQPAMVCEPSSHGEGTLCFYSDWEPRAVDGDLLVLKAGQQICFGHLVGELPECYCDSPVLPESWGTVKKLFE